MAWGKIKNNCKKPFWWWYHKFACEFGWAFRNQFDWGWDLYYKHLDMCAELGFNIYGEPIDNHLLCLKIKIKTLNMRIYNMRHSKEQERLIRIKNRCIKILKKAERELGEYRTPLGNYTQKKAT